MFSGIRLAEKRDIPALCELWTACFDDSFDYVSYFYRENFDNISVPVYTVDGKPVSMINLIDAAFADGTDEYPVKYVYAAGTLPGFRNKGIMSSVFLHEIENATENGYGLFLKPVPGLIGYYASLGFETDNNLHLCSFGREPCDSISVVVSDISAQEYNSLRNSVFSKKPYVKWPEVHVKWCIDENAFCGGRTISVSVGGEKHLMMACPVNGVLKVIETDLNYALLRRISGILCGFFGAASLTAYMPDAALGKSEPVVSSVVYNAPLRHSYANLLIF